MRNVSLISALVALVALGVFNCTEASAQSNTCSLTLNVTSVDKDGQSKQVRNARAVAVRKNGRRNFAAVLVSGSPQFPRLRDGAYRLTITKRGFRRAVQDVNFMCGAMNAEGTAEIRLEPGSLGRTMAAAPQFVSAGIVRKGVTTLIGTSDPSATYDSSAKNDEAIPLALPKAPIMGGVLNGKALVLSKPIYPLIARQAHASGTVTVQVVIDEEGNVMSAHAIAGHPLLRAVSVEAARSSKFSPTKLSGQAVKVAGVITYNFVAQ